MQIHPASAGKLGAEITDIDLRELTPQQAEQLRQAVYTHKLVRIRKQTCTPAEYVELGRKIGEPVPYLLSHYHHPDFKEIFVSSNVLYRGKKIGVAGTGRFWHSDYQFCDKPLSFTMLNPQVVPSSKRETYFIDLEHVYEVMPAELRALVEGRTAVQDCKWRYKITPDDIDLSVQEVMDKFSKEFPPVTHPAVIQHPVTKKKALYLSSGFTTAIEGISREESDKALAKLFAYIERKEHIHAFVWELGDVLLWENRTLCHHASTTPVGEASMSFRISLYDALPFYVGAKAQ